MSGMELCKGYAGVLVEVCADLDEYPKTAGLPHYGANCGCIRCLKLKGNLDDFAEKATERTHGDFIAEAIAMLRFQVVNAESLEALRSA